MRKILSLIGAVIVLGGFSVGFYFFGHHLGYNDGYQSSQTVAKTKYAKLQKQDNKKIADLNQQRTNLKQQLALLKLDESYNNQTVASGQSTQSSLPLSCTSEKYGVYNQFTSTDCY